MKNIRFRAALALAACLGASPSVRGAEPAPLPPPLETVVVAPGLWMLVGEGGNIGVSVGADGTFIVDDQYAPAVPRILAAVASLVPQGATAPTAPRFVINTHWHGDHTGGNEALGAAGAVIVAHENVRRRMSVPQFIQTYRREVPASPPQALPVVTFTDAVTLHLNGDDVHVFHVARAHTDGDAVVHFRRANVIHAGDLYFNGFYPFIDVSSGGGVRGMIAAADAMLALANDDTRIIPGHGALSNVSELREYRRMLHTVTERVARLVAAGKSAEDVVAAKPSAEWDATWGAKYFSPERWIGMVYADLVRERGGH